MQLQALGRKPLLRSLIGVMMLPSNGRLGTLVLLVSYVQFILLSGLYQTLDRVRRGTLLIVMPLSFFRGSPLILCTSSLVHRFSKLPSHFVRRGSMCGIALFLTGGSGHPTCQLHCRSADLRCRCFVWMSSAHCAGLLPGWTTFHPRRPGSSPILPATTTASLSSSTFRKHCTRGCRALACRASCISPSYQCRMPWT